MIVAGLGVLIGNKRTIFKRNVVDKWTQFFQSLALILIMFGVKDIFIIWFSVALTIISGIYSIFKSGVVITSTSFKSSAWDVLKEGDVILAIDGNKLANNGTIPFVGEERILFSYLLSDKFPGDILKIDILREGKEQKIQMPLIVDTPIVSVCEFDVMPSYYIYGGIVFAPLTLNYFYQFGQKC